MAALNRAVSEVAAGDAALARVLSLPRREPATAEQQLWLSAFLRVRGWDDTCPAGPGTAEDPCKRCGGTGRLTLRPAQADALLELYEMRGLFGALGTGSGKTLVSLLAATLLCALRPILLIPSTLESKTKREFVAYAQDWRVRLPAIVSYELLQQPKRERLLWEGNDELGIPAMPDLVICDEVQGLYNYDSARGRRFLRYIEDAQPIVAVMSGTLFGPNLMRYHHLGVSSLGDRVPMPTQRADAERWASALDRDLGVLHRTPLGPLELLPGGYHEHFRNSRGVVAMQTGDCDASIRVSLWRPELAPELRRVIDGVAASSLRPDDELLGEWELPDCLSQLALGFYYVWDPPPPDWWMRPRRAWVRYVRDVLDQRLEGFDSEAPIRYALDRNDGTAPEQWRGQTALAEWRAVKEQFEPNPVPIWLDRSVLQCAADHARVPGTLTWTRFRAAGMRLHECGLPYYGRGTDPEVQARKGEPIALSLRAHGTGRNLQYGWHRNLFLTIPAEPDMHEQAIARTHRAQQRADVVEVEYINAIDYHGKVLSRALAGARATAKASGFEQKLTLADWA